MKNIKCIPKINGLPIRGILAKICLNPDFLFFFFWEQTYHSWSTPPKYMRSRERSCPIRYQKMGWYWSSPHQYKIHPQDINSSQLLGFLPFFFFPQSYIHTYIHIHNTYIWPPPPPKSHQEYVTKRNLTPICKDCDDNISHAKTYQPNQIIHASNERYAHILINIACRCGKGREGGEAYPPWRGSCQRKLVRNSRDCERKSIAFFVVVDGED